MSTQRPSDSPDFYRLPAPAGRSRESRIVLDVDGHFWNDGERIEHERLERALHTWIRRHPDDGRLVLDNGYDWTYFRCEGTPFHVRSIRLDGPSAWLTLSDGSEERWDPRGARLEGPALIALVKRKALGGPFDARFDRHAQASLMPLLEERDGSLCVTLDGETTTLPMS